MSQNYKALIVDKQEEETTLKFIQKPVTSPKNGEVLIKVKYSGVNYKDCLATIPNGNIVTSYPMVPGIDLAGTIISSADNRFKEGDDVIATSYEIGVSRDGGYAEYAYIPADWVISLPKGLTLREAMIIGTAGFTAALSVQRLQENQVAPDQGPVIVTGATGGVGSFAVSFLAKLGFTVEASTGKLHEAEYLEAIGATNVIPRDEVYNGKVRALGKQRWAAGVDPVGGEPLASLLSQIKYGGSVAASGLTAGTKIPSSVFPFILRGINLLGIDSVQCPMHTRQHIWARLATDLKLDQYENHIQQEVTLDELPSVFPILLKGEARGRTIVVFPD